jgi:hypothetical protein
MGTHRLARNGSGKRGVGKSMARIHADHAALRADKQ